MRERRIELELTMRDLAERSGVSEDAIDAIENRRRRRGMTVDELMGLAHGLRTTGCSLLPPDSDYFTEEEKRAAEEEERKRYPSTAPDVSALVAELTTRGFAIGFTRFGNGFSVKVTGPGGYDYSTVADDPYAALTAAYPGSTPLQRYDRGAHLAWAERMYPDADKPAYPVTEDEAIRAIAEYTSDGREN